MGPAALEQMAGSLWTKVNDLDLWHYIFMYYSLSRPHISLIPLTLTVVGAPQMMVQQYLSHLSVSPVVLREYPKSIPDHSLMLSSHIFFCLPLLRAPFTDPCRIVFAIPEDLEMWPYHLSFRFSTMVRRSSCTPIAFWILLQTKDPCSSHGLCRKWSEVSYSISSQWIGSFSRVLLSRSSFHRHKGMRIRCESASA